MVLRSLIAAAAILAVGAPLGAQAPMGQSDEGWTWTADRPDANGRLGVFGVRALAAGELDLQYRFSQTNYQGIYIGTDSLGLEEVLQRYQNAPLTRSEVVHDVRLRLGITDRLTLLARGGFAAYERETTTATSMVRVGVNELTDAEVGLLYNVYGDGPYRLDFQAGAVIPTMAGNTTYGPTSANTVGELSYDMRTSAGTVGVIGAIGGNVQNEVGSLGAKMQARVFVGESDAGYTPGDQYEANGWAAYNVNDHLSVLAGIRWQSWGNIEGADPDLDAMADPHNEGRTLSGQHALLPLGLNLVIPGESVLAGHILSLEAVYPLHRDLESPQLGVDWGLNLGYRMTF
ncbi:MAG: hypothetical protein R3304_10135 [Longimicrobiales bacterium]|nr:hypothetical protein [Longimicrobiales bacterium]